MIILDQVRGLMAGEDCLVVAPGPSSLELEPRHYESYWTIACNRALPYARADFAVCIEREHADPCWRIVRAANPLLCFSQCTAPFKRTVKIDMDLNQWLTPPANEEPFRLAMSPWYAAAVAMWLGFETIGLVGVDLHLDRYPKNKFREEFELRWKQLTFVAYSADRTLINCNLKSSLEAVPKGVIDGVRSK